MEYSEQEIQDLAKKMATEAQEKASTGNIINEDQVDEILAKALEEPNGDGKDPNEI